MNSRPLRAILYARVSTDIGEPDESQPRAQRQNAKQPQDPESQLGALRKWAQQRGWQVVSEETDRITSDPRRRKHDPPGLNRALHAIAERKADVLAIFSADRLVAHPLALLQLVGRIQDLGGKVASLQDGRDLDTTDELGEFMVYIYGWINRMRIKLIRAGTKAGLARARAAGKRLGRPPVTLPDLDSLRRCQTAGKGIGGIAVELGCSEWAVRQALRALGKDGMR